MRESGTVVPVLGWNVEGMGVALPVRDEAGHACDLRVGAAVAEVEEERPDGAVVPEAEDACGHMAAHGVEMPCCEWLGFSAVEGPPVEDGARDECFALAG